MSKKTKLPLWLSFLAITSVFLAIGVFGAYAWVFGPKLSSNQEIWGLFGDFVGGSLNPLFALIGLFALLYTIVLQSSELQHSTEQLQKSAEALNAQNTELKKQSFDSTFFQLTHLFNEIISQLRVPADGEEPPYKARRCFGCLYRELKNSYLHKVVRGDFVEPDSEAIDIQYSDFYRRYGSFIGHYFRTLYNILKFIDKSLLSDEEKKRYADLIRAQLSKFELALLLYNCISHYGNEQMLLLINKYNTLKHLEEGTLADKSHVQILREL